MPDDPMPTERERFAARRARTIAAARGLAAELTASTAQCELLEQAVDELAAAYSSEATPTFALRSTQLPMLIGAGLGTPASQSDLLSVALAFVHIGVDVLDDLQDHDPPRYWADRPSGERLLGAVTLMGPLACAALDELDVSSRLGAELYSCMSAGLLEVGAGQQLDLRLGVSSDPSCEDILQAVAGKSGALLGMYAGLAARLGGAAADGVQSLETMARCFGIASQLRSDLFDLLGDETSRDLASGTVTLPLAYHRRALGNEQRRAFDLLAEDARGAPEARAKVRAELHSSTAVRATAMVIDSNLRWSLAALFDARLSRNATSELEGMIRDSAFFSHFQAQDP